MFHTIVHLQKKGKKVKKESNKCNGLEHVPACSTWPPPWLASSTPPRVVAKPELPESSPDVSSWDLTPEQYERWKERVCIMHYDGKLPWQTAEALALADVLGQTDPRAGKVKTEPAAAPGPVEQALPVVQQSLFAAGKGPYAPNK